MAAHSYSFGELENLWIDAGGPRKVAPIMAAVALAESSGNPKAKHRNANGSVDRGLWQINSSHGYSAASSFNPQANARQAVAVYHSQGFRAWSTYTSGAYLSHLAAGVSPGGGGFGILTSTNFAGVDQGVDYRGAGPIPALDTIRITSVRRVNIIEGGSWPLVGFRYLDGPYKGRYGYVMENFSPKVRVGQTLKRGQTIGVAKGAYPYIEYGFAANASGAPLAPLSSSDPHAATSAGQAMRSYIEQRGGEPVKPAPGGSGSSGGGGGGGGVGGAISGAAGGLAASVGQAGHDIAAPFESIAGGVSSVSGFIGKITDPHFWLRALELVGGIVLIILGLYLLARQVGVAQPVEDVAGVLPVGRAAKLGDAAAAEMQFSPGRAARADSSRTRRRSVPAPGYEPNTRRRELATRAQPSDEIPF